MSRSMTVRETNRARSGERVSFTSQGGGGDRRTRGESCLSYAQTSAVHARLGAKESTPWSVQKPHPASLVACRDTPAMPLQRRAGSLHVETEDDVDVVSAALEVELTLDDDDLPWHNEEAEEMRFQGQPACAREQPRKS